MFRHLFPLFAKQKLIYFDSAATSQKPRSVLEALSKFYSENYGSVHRSVYEIARLATAEYEAARETVRRFLNANSSEEIVFTKGTTESINLVAASFGRTFLKEGDEILIPETEHHANIVPWQILCKEIGAHLKVIPVNDQGELLLQPFSEKTKLVSLAHISHITGVIHPVKEVVRLAKQVGAAVFLDGAQAVAHTAIDVQDLDVDFFAFSGHKAFGPTGVGVLYGKKELLEKMPPYQAGGNMIEKVTLEGSTFQETPHRFEAGTPMIGEVIGLKAALEFMQQIGHSAIATVERELLVYATDKLCAIPGLRIFGNVADKGPIISFAIEGVHPLDLATLLDIKGIAVRSGHLCAQPAMKRFGVSAMTRISFGPYNTLDEIDLFSEILSRILTHPKDLSR